MTSMTDMKESLKRLYYGRISVEIDFYFVAEEGKEQSVADYASRDAIDDSDWRYDANVDVNEVGEDHVPHWDEDSLVYGDAEDRSLGWWLVREKEAAKNRKAWKLFLEKQGDLF